MPSQPSPDTATSDPVVAARSGGDPVVMRHGRWSAEVRGDEIADLACDGVPLVRAIRPVVRDHDWNTVAVRVLHQRTEGPDLRTELIFEAPGIGYRSTIRLTVDGDALTVDLVGEALTSFRRNRIGLVVLHRADDAGRAVRVRHTDGTTEPSHWPTTISPHQPFVDVAGFDWTRDGVRADLELGGEVFETEDQRNWTDASFKTYGTPLDRPFPVEVAVGDQVHQWVRLSAVSRPEPRPEPGTRPEPVDGPITTGRPTGTTVPPISLGAGLFPPPDPDLLTALSPAYDAVLVELTGPASRWPARLTQAAAQAEALGTGLDVRVVTDDPGVLDRTLVLLGPYRLVRLSAYRTDTHVTTTELWGTLQAGARRHRLDPSGGLLGGTRAHYTELNRQRAAIPASVPTLTFSLTPQMHATEIPHLVDSLATQRTVVLNAVHQAAGRPVHVGPVTLRRRFNAVATGERPTPADEAAASTDPLQGTGFAAAWTLASVAALAVNGVAGLCYYETVGPRGVVDGDGRLTPAGQVLDTVATWRGRSILEVTAPPRTAVLATRSPDGAVELLVADLSGEDRTLALETTTGAAEWVRLPPWSVTARTG